MENHSQHNRNNIQQPLLGANGVHGPHVKQVLIEDDDQDTFLQDAAVQGLRGKLQVEIKRLLALALPLAGQNILAFSLSLISVGFIGHLGKYELSVAVLATSLYNLTGNSVIQGMAGGMETLCGQAYGAGRYKQVGVVLQRALAVLSLIAVLVIGVWSQAGPLLLALGQSAELATGAARYIHIISPALLMLVVCECLKRYLMTQGVVHPPLVITCVVTLLSPLYNWFFIHFLQWHLDGAAVAFDAQMATIAGAMLCYVVARDTYLRGKPEQTWHGLSHEALTGWGQYLGLALPSCGMVCLEWWIFEAVILLAGRLPDPEVSVSVMGICMNIISCIYMVPLGLGAATSTRISNYLGANFPDNARLCARVAVAMCFVITLVTCTGVVGSRSVLAYLFTADAEVVAHTATVLPILAAALLGDAVLATLAGVLRGCGRQVVGAAMNAVAYWGLGFPLAYTLAFDYHLGTRGLWLGLATVTTLQSCVIGAYVSRIQWAKEADAAMDRVLALAGDAASVGGEEGGVEEGGHELPGGRGWAMSRSQPMPSMLGSGSVGAHPLTYSYGGSYQARPLATSFTGSHSHTHRVLGGVANTSYPDLEAAARAVQGMRTPIVGSRPSNE